MATAQRTTGQRPGGRSAAVLSALKTAVEELVAERGSERVTLPMVAERAGVNPSSVYRRWGDLATMINDVATYRLDPHRRLPDSGDLVADLTAWAEEGQNHYSDPPPAPLFGGGAAARRRLASGSRIACATGAPRPRSFSATRHALRASAWRT